MANPHQEEPIVFFDISIGGDSARRMPMRLFINQTPLAVENFRRLCNGTHGLQNAPPYCYKFAPFFKVVPGFMCQGGDFTSGDGFGGHSAIGNFSNENYIMTHARRGALAMANPDPDINGSQFYITFVATPWLDGKHVVIGEVTEDGMAVLQAIENVGTEDGTPSKRVIIEGCGQIINGEAVPANNDFRWLDRSEEEQG